MFARGRSAGRGAGARAGARAKRGGSAGAGVLAGKNAGAATDPYAGDECEEEAIALAAASAGKRRRRMPFTARLILGLIAVTACTALASLIVLYALWSRSFAEYTAENFQWYAQNTASQIAVAFENTGKFDEESLQPAAATVEVSPDIVLKVYNAQGEVVFADSKVAPKEDLDAFKEPVYIVASADIVVGGDKVGTVKLWVYGANSLINKHDEALKKDTIFALNVAVVAAAIVASIAGFAMARRLTRPIKSLTVTTERIAHGDLSARTNVSGTDEIARLGLAIDEMACAIERDRVLERRITTDMAHEIRTPLMAIRATVEAMVDGVFPTDQEHLKVVEVEVVRISRLVDELMRLSRMEAQTSPFAHEDVDLSALVSEVAMSFTAMAASKGLSLDLDAAPGLHTQGDGDMIKQAVTNLVSNAIRYTDTGRIDVVLKSEGGEGGEAGWVRLDVRDTGIGLSEDDQKVVFDRLWRADSARESNNGGLGIGLAMVREIMNRLGGSAQVESKLGEGSTFTLVFPMKS